MEIDIAHSNMRKEQQLKELYNQMAFDNDAEAITSFFSLTKEDRNEKMKAFSKKWKEENHQSFDGLWEKMKKEILTKQENWFEDLPIWKWGFEIFELNFLPPKRDQIGTFPN